MADFVFYNRTKVYFGMKKFSGLFHETGHYGKRILLVMGQGSVKKNGIYQRVMQEISDGFVVEEYSGIQTNPDVSLVNAGASVCRQKKIELIIALGGGSVIDCAKAIGVLAASNTEDIRDILSRKVAIENSIPVIAIPTTAATGSEMNGGAVISDYQKKTKIGFGDEIMQPVCAFYVPEFTFTMTARQTAASSADLICHIFDSGYFSRNGEMELLKSVQEGVLKTVIKTTYDALQKTDDLAARENLLWSSSWALNGFMYQNIKQDNAVHIIEHAISAYYPSIHHGLGIAIILPRWLQYISQFDETREEINRFGANVLSINDGSIQKIIETFANILYEDWKLPSHLRDFSVDENSLSLIANDVGLHGKVSSIHNLSTKDILEIVKMSY